MGYNSRLKKERANSQGSTFYNPAAMVVKLDPVVENEQLRREVARLKQAVEDLRFFANEADRLNNLNHSLRNELEAHKEGWRLIYNARESHLAKASEVESVCHRIDHAVAGITDIATFQNKLKLLTAELVRTYADYTDLCKRIISDRHAPEALVEDWQIYVRETVQIRGQYLEQALSNDPAEYTQAIAELKTIAERTPTARDAMQYQEIERMRLEAEIKASQNQGGITNRTLHVQDLKARLKQDLIDFPRKRPVKQWKKVLDWYIAKYEDDPEKADLIKYATETVIPSRTALSELMADVPL